MELKYLSNGHYAVINQWADEHENDIMFIGTLNECNRFISENKRY